MISRVLEWYRIVNVKPSPETIERRTTAIQELVQAYDDSEEWDIVLGAVAGVVAGFESGHAQDSSAVSQIVSSLRGKDVTVPQDLKDNAMELRAAAATAIGELIGRNADKAPDNTAILLAMLIESGFGIRPIPPERYLKQMVEELRELARRTLNRAQQVGRRRGTAGKSLMALQDAPPEAVAGMKALTPALKTAVKELLHQASIDREELQILWWLFSGASATTGHQFSSMNAGAASVAAGAELAELCLLPPPSNAEAFISRAVEHVKKIDAKRTLEKVIEETDSSVRGLLIRQDATASLDKDYPTLFPLSWLSHRLADSNGAPTWAAEYQNKTGLSASQSLESTSVAVQAFRERIAQRQYASMIEE